MHGYRIKQHIENNFGHMWSINYGQIYPNLRKLEEEGLVTILRVEQEGKPHKKLYSLTQKGKQEFQKWLESTPEKGMLLRDPFLMRFVFFGFGNNEQSLKLLEEQIKLYEKQLAQRNKNVEKRQKQDTHVRLISELGVALNEMYLGWLKLAYKELSQGQEEKETVHTQNRIIADL
jgi:DNA-binding PadR family transcriptional regulator